jgi:hypothetical protein
LTLIIIMIVARLPSALAIHTQAACRSTLVHSPTLWPKCADTKKPQDISCLQSNKMAAAGEESKGGALESKGPQENFSFLELATSTWVQFLLLCAILELPNRIFFPALVEMGFSGLEVCQDTHRGSLKGFRRKLHSFCSQCSPCICSVCSLASAGFLDSRLDLGRFGSWYDLDCGVTANLDETRLQVVLRLDTGRLARLLLL